jgi:hypothetical protein
VDKETQRESDTRESYGEKAPLEAGTVSDTKGPDTTLGLGGVKANIGYSHVALMTS